jgi:acyl-homoserine-lactone acylase
MNRLFLFIPALLLALGTAAQSPRPRGCEVLWDRYGVPHLFARTDEALLYGYGYAQAEAHANLILRLYAQSRGRGAELLGESYAEADRWVLLNSVPERAQNWYRAQKPAFRNLLDAFAAGINAYAERHPEAIDAALKPVLPVSAVDVLAHSHRVIHFSFVAPSAASQAAAAQLPDRNGSNTWAIAPKRSASGKALLLTNPHLPWQDFYTYFEAQLVGPGLNAYGITRIGFPAMTMFFTDDIATAQTVNTHDGQDFYELTLQDGGYRYDGRIRPFVTKTRTFRIKQGDGTLREETLTLRESVHGPVVGERGGRAVAMRVVGLDRPFMLQQYWDLCHARNLREFEAVLSRLQIPMFTYSYADRHGQIFNLFNAQVPRRSHGDWKTWSGLVRGDTSGTLWTTYHAYAELPKTTDPPSGYLQNCNESPWTVTFPMPHDPARYPAYLAPPPGMSFRTQRSVRMLLEDSSMTLDELVQYKHSTRLELADRLLDDLGRAVAAQAAAAQAVAAQSDSGATEAIAVLNAWDRQTNADSRGAVLFEAFAKEWSKSVGGMARINSASPLFATPWNPADPVRTPDGIARPEAAVAALREAARQVKAQHGRLDVAWGEVYRFKIPGPDGALTDVPANGGPGPLGAFRVMTFASTGRALDNPIRPFHGDTYVAAVEMGTPVRARVLIGYGNWSQPGSRHRTDQLDLLQKQQLRTPWRTRGEIEQNLEKRERL